LEDSPPPIPPVPSTSGSQGRPEIMALAAGEGAVISTREGDRSDDDAAGIGCPSRKAGLPRRLSDYVLYGLGTSYRRTQN